MLTYEQLAAELRYDPETGHIWWVRGAHQRDKNRPAGYVNKRGYRVITFLGKPRQAHRIAWCLATGEWPERGIDHKNRQPDDNRLENLRLASGAENQVNKRVYGRVGLKGVVLRKRSCRVGKPYRAQITVRGVRIYLGSYATPEEAHGAYMMAAREYFGEFAAP
jgi:hypothetical protein